MFPQYPVRQCSMSQQFYGAVEIAFQPFAGNAGIGVVVQCFVDTGNGFHLLQYCMSWLTSMMAQSLLISANNWYRRASNRLSI